MYALRRIVIDYWRTECTKGGYRLCWMVTCPITRAEKTIFYFAHGVKPDADSLSN